MYYNYKRGMGKRNRGEMMKKTEFKDLSLWLKIWIVSGAIWTVLNTVILLVSFILGFLGVYL
jgi:hypothetical protein